MVQYVVMFSKFNGHPMANPFMSHLVECEDITTTPRALGYLRLLRQMVQEIEETVVDVRDGKEVRVRDLEASDIKV